METVTTQDAPVTGTEVEVVESTAHPRVSWGAIFAGAVVALAVWAMLYALGLAIGLASLEPSDPSTIKSSGIFTGIWGLIAPLLALFVGGVVAARSSGVTRKFDGAIHGLVMWGLSTVAGAWLVATVMSALMAGAASFGRTSMQSAAESPRAREAIQAPMSRAREALQDVRRGQAIAAAEDSSKAFAGAFGALLLGMISAVVGSVVGVRTKHPPRRVVTTTSERPPLSTQREAYP